MMRFDELREAIEALHTLRAEHGRDSEPFEIQAVCIDRFGLAGYREQAEIGVTDAIVVPWLNYGAGFDADIESKKDGIKRFADEVITKL